MKNPSILLAMTVALFLRGAGAALADNFSTATNLIGQGQYKQAAVLLESIPESDPAYSQAQPYQALCLYGTGDARSFMNLMEQGGVPNSETDPNMAEELRADEIKTLFAYRKFDRLLSKCDSFRTDFNGSSNGPVVLEIQEAGLFERGLKKAIESASLTDTNKAERWSEAQGNLQQFLSLVQTSAATNYTYFTNRVLREDVWRAEITLDQSAVALAAIPVGDAASLERFSFLRILLNEKLHREDLDGNLGLMSDYLSKFGPSPDRIRVALEMSEYSFRKGETFGNLAQTAEGSGDSAAAQQQRTQMMQYFQEMQTLQPEIVTNKDAGVELSDVVDEQEDLLYSYFLEKNYDKVLSTGSAMIAASNPGDQAWLVGHLYRGITYANLPSPDYASATSELDTIIKVGFSGHPHPDHLVLFATKWRITVAQKTGDKSKARDLVLWVNSSHCPKNLKSDFIKTFGHIANLQ